MPRLTKSPKRPSAPIVELHSGISVVRDDLFPGGTKARFLPLLFEDCEELVYASPCEGGAQTAIATVAAQLGKRATIFIAKRKTPHPRALMAKRLGAKVYQVEPGYLTVVQARARAYCEATGAKLAPFGIDMPEAIERIAAAARMIEQEPEEVWCACGSGVLARGLALAWPKARRHVVRVGREIFAKDVAGAEIHETLLKFEQPYRGEPAPFPSDPHYDAKAWSKCQQLHLSDRTLFWNVTGPAQP